MQRTALWRGNTRPSLVQTAGLHLTRFVPGRTGTGYTDDLDTVAAQMQRRNIVALNHFPSLWYERRRDDHGRSRRADADVWAPFYEQPFSRSGEGEAFDRLSKYDLKTFNPWFWQRLTRFAELADRQGFLLVEDHYLQHNIIEEGAHWADYPWRSANNINDLGFPENTYYAGDKRVFMADRFYDVANAQLAAYHRNYIRKHLDDLGGYANVLHHLGAEFTGPAHFVRFWLDVIDEWERETGKDVKVMLSATKDVTDAILGEARYSRMLDVIDIRQWHYRRDGSLYAPDGGVSLTERQYVRIVEPDDDNFDGIYRAISEYRLKYPEKAVVYSFRNTPGKAWLTFVAGGSLLALPTIAEDRFYRETVEMTPLPALTSPGAYWGMGKAALGYVVYTQAGQLTLDLADDKTTYVARWFTPGGQPLGKRSTLTGGKALALEKPGTTDAILWLSKK
jgi:hypothetical protein